MLLEVGRNTRFEGLAANGSPKLLQNRCSLGVGDSVEVDLNILEVTNLGDNRVSRRQLILRVCPRLLAECKGGPGIFPFGGLGHREVRCIFGEGLVEPQVIPPLHGD